MEREILFKGQMVTGKWVYGLPSLDIKGSTAYWNECSYRISWSEGTARKNAPVKNGTLCQFTGLTDKNGAKIFEGDTREGSYYCGDDRIFYKDKIVFEGGSFNWINCEGYDYRGKPTFCDTEVTGNIHDTTQH